MRGKATTRSRSSGFAVLCICALAAIALANTRQPPWRDAYIANRGTAHNPFEVKPDFPGTVFTRLLGKHIRISGTVWHGAYYGNLLETPQGPVYIRGYGVSTLKVGSRLRLIGILRHEVIVTERSDAAASSEHPDDLTFVAYPPAGRVEHWTLEEVMEQ